MLITAFHCHSLCIPFKTSFKHHAATRDETASVWLRIESACGQIGYGESCPRMYVTGETVESALVYIHKIAPSIIEAVHSVEDLRDWMRNEQAELDVHPAAFCAVELALLDLLGKTQSASVECILSLPAVVGDFGYSAVLGDSDLANFETKLGQYKKIGFSDYKVKISGDLKADAEKVAVLQAKLGPTGRCRFDANNIWQSAKDAIAYLKELNAPVWAIEEPVGVGDYEAMREIAQSLDVKIILDESFLKLADLELLKQDPEQWIINVRISKMGGVIRSREIAEAVLAAGHGLIIGAQVGESSLLTRAALSIAQLTAGALLAQEGAFGLHLLEEDVLTEPLMFGAAGVLHAEKRGFAQAPGFGLTIKDMSAFFQS